jgi:hypothetical protein
MKGWWHTFVFIESAKDVPTRTTRLKVNFAEICILSWMLVEEIRTLRKIRIDDQKLIS